MKPLSPAPRRFAGTALLPLYELLSLVGTIGMGSCASFDVGRVLDLRSRAGTNSGDLAFAPGYYTAGDRGGGWFTWDPSASNSDDGGRFIAPAGRATGRWVRVLNGETANVKMWGARGDRKANDTLAIQSAVDACKHGQGWTMELLFPSGTYLLTNTIVFQGQVHIRGEGLADNTMIVMQGDHDVFQTTLAHRLLSGVKEYGWDHWFIFENLYIDCGDSKTNAALVLSNPGEGSVIRNLVSVKGGYGIRCFGVGAPGLRIMDTSIFDVAVANIAIEGYLPNGIFLLGGNTVTLIGVSGDHQRADSDATACFLKINKCWPSVSVYDFKAEGQFGGGLFRYDWQADRSGGPDVYHSIMGSLRIFGGTYNCDHAPGNPKVDCDFIVLTNSGSWTPAVYINQPTMTTGVRYLIRDDVTGRKVPRSASYTQARLPMMYESFLSTDNGAPRSRLVIGDSALYHLVPPKTGWYRVMTGLVRHMGGRLIISSLNERTELSFNVAPGVGAGGAAVTLTRKSISQPWESWKPRVTLARAGSYFDPSPAVNGPRAFLDIFVERLPEPGQWIVLAHPLEGESQVWTGVEAVELLAPTAPLENVLPVGSTVLYTCVTNNLAQ